MYNFPSNKIWEEIPWMELQILSSNALKTLQILALIVQGITNCLVLMVRHCVEQNKVESVIRQSILQAPGQLTLESGIQLIDANQVIAVNSYFP
jgi:hypothetical protein